MSGRAQLIVTVFPPSPVKALALSDPLIAIGQSGTVSTAVYGPVALTELNQTSAANALVDRMWLHTVRRNGNAAAARMSNDVALAPGFHNLVDPATAPELVTLIFESYVSAAIAVGLCDVAIGYVEHIDPTLAATLVGVGFRCGPDHIWHTFVNDCPTNVAPVTVRRDVAIVGKLASDLHRMAIVVDGAAKTIYWLIDGLIVDQWKPGAALDQMTPLGPKVQWCVVVPALGDATLRLHGGGIPQLRLLAK